MSEDIERRFLVPPGSIGIAPAPATGTGESIGTVEGYAVVFDAFSEDLGGWKERIAAGAFTDALKPATQPILGLYDHALGGLLGSTAVGSLRLAEDARGLRFSLDLPPTTLGNDILALVRRGDLSGVSIGFRPDRKAMQWSKSDGGGVVCTVRRVSLLREVSLVALPAYPATSVSLAAPARPMTPAQQRCHDAIAKMRRAVAAAV